MEQCILFRDDFHQLLAELCPFENLCVFVFLAYSSYSLHPIKLKLDSQLDHDVAQLKLFRRVQI